MGNREQDTNPQYEVRVGQVFGRLTLLIRVDGRLRGAKVKWVCQCECGERKIIMVASLVRGQTRSCGCLSREISAANCRVRITHGNGRRGADGRKRMSPEYRSWNSMKLRCYQSAANGYENYGGRGIVVCDRWRDSFEAFLEDLGLKPSPRHTIGRKDNDGNYEPGNAQWETPEEQYRNKRNSHLLIVDGVSGTVAEWARWKGLSAGLLYQRLASGWTPERAVTVPARPVLRG